MGREVPGDHRSRWHRPGIIHGLGGCGPARWRLIISVKPDGKPWTVREQIVDDPVTGLTFQFEMTPGGEPRLRLFGTQLPNGNREITFNARGEEAGAGTGTSGLCRPAWLEPVG